MDPRIHRRSESEKGPGDLVHDQLNITSLIRIYRIIFE